MVEVLCDPEHLVAEGELAAIARAVAEAITVLETTEAVTFGDVNVLIVDTDQICALHLQYFGDPSPTDVITFPSESEADGARVDGDIAICVDVAREQAVEAGHELRAEIVFLAVHGLLHLCGWDDRTTADRARMIARQNEVLAYIGSGSGRHH